MLNSGKIINEGGKFNMKFNKKWLWLIIPLIIFSLCWMNSSSISTVLLAIKGTITDGNLIKFSGTAGLGEDAGIGIETTGEVDFGSHSAGFTLQTLTGDGTDDIDWRLGLKFKFTFGPQNETLTFTAPTNPCNLLLVLVQDGTGSRTVTWPTIKWPGGTVPTLSTDANAEDMVCLFYDGTSYYGVASSAFAVP